MSRGRMLAGFPSASAGQTIALAPRAAHRFELQQGDLLRIDGTAHPGQICLLAFASDGTRMDEAFGVGTPTPIPSADFEGAELRAWIAAQGGDKCQAERAVRIGP
ncbi:MAG: aminomethyltransferase, partial [Pseudomonadota bacterium]